MPPPLLLDITEFDLENPLYTREQIYEILPHRHEFMQLDAIVHLDTERGEAVALRDVRDDEFWVRGHIPSRPIMPGVLMIEAAGQLASFLSAKSLDLGGRFVGFGGVDKVKFRDSVAPNSRLLILGKATEIRPRRVVCATQILVGKKMVFEGIITGMPI